MCRLLVFSAALGFLYLLFSTLEHLLVVVGHLGHETIWLLEMSKINGSMPSFCGRNPCSESQGQTGLCCQSLEAFLVTTGSLALISRQDKKTDQFQWDIKLKPGVGSLLLDGGELDDL